MSIDYKNVYELSSWEGEIFAAERRVAEAEKLVEKVTEAYQGRCASVTGIPRGELEFSNVMCMAKGIARHVYHKKVRGSRYGSPENKCIFCGCDDVEDLF